MTLITEIYDSYELSTTNPDYVEKTANSLSNVV